MAPATVTLACDRPQQMADGLLEAVRGLHLAHPELGSKPLLAKLREQSSPTWQRVTRRSARRWRR